MKSSKILASAAVFLVADVIKAANYYKEVLGFNYDRLWGEPPDFCMVWRDSSCIMLSQSPDKTAIRSNTSIVWAIWDAYFWVDEVDALFQEFKNKEVIVFYEPFVKPYGVKEFVVKDLDGYQLAFGQDLEEEKGE